jgi:hypothetical protein
MKKLALILALMLIPCAAFGLEMLDNNAMDEITGQGGVNIAVDDVQLFINIEKMAWIDCDGFDVHEGKGTCGGHGGAIALNNFQIDVMNINAITGSADGIEGNGTSGYGSQLNTVRYAGGQFGTNLGLVSTPCGKIPLFYNYATDAAGGCGLSSLAGNSTLGLDNYYGFRGSYHAFTPHFLSIDVTDALPISSAGFLTWGTHGWTIPAVTDNGGTSDSTIGGVLIGLPTVEIYIGDMSFQPVYDGDLVGQTSMAINDDTHVDAYGNTADFGVIQMHGITFTVLSGWIEISPK